MFFEYGTFFIFFMGDFRNLSVATYHRYFAQIHLSPMYILDTPVLVRWLVQFHRKESGVILYITNNNIARQNAEGR